MRKAFTLIELLVIVAIIGAMIAVSALGVRAGQGAVRVKGAARDIMAYIRHARSVALVSMQPAVVTYSTESVDDEVCARIKVDSAKLMDTRRITSAETIFGEKVAIGDEGGGEGGGDTVEDVLFAPISDDVVKGVRIKVLVGDETLTPEEDSEKRRSKFSVFSNVDYLLGRYRDEQTKKAEESKTEEDAGSAASTAFKEDQAPVNLIWEVNGRCEPHRVYVFADGDRPENGILIKVDRFGGLQAVDGEDKEK